MSKSVNLLQRLALTYKASRFPWKKHAVVGYDLSGNEYWDCPNPLGIVMLKCSPLSLLELNHTKVVE